MVLGGGEEGGDPLFDQFHQAAIGGDATDLVARFQEQVAIGVIELVAVPVPFKHDLSTT